MMASMMASRFVITVGAAREIESIVDYITNILESPAESDSFVSEFREALRLICAFPESRPLCPDPLLKQKGYRAFRVKNYIALYVFADGIVYVDHVFHQRQDYAALIME